MGGGVLFLLLVKQQRLKFSQSGSWSRRAMVRGTGQHLYLQPQPAPLSGVSGRIQGPWGGHIPGVISGVLLLGEAQQVGRQMGACLPDVLWSKEGKEGAVARLFSS